MPINYSEYHPKWKLISYLIRKVRALNKCEWCGAENGKPHPITGSKVVLIVAHIDRDKTNNRFNNLTALCQRCHLRHDLKQHIANRKYGRNHKGQHQLVLPWNTPCNKMLHVVTTLIFKNLKPLLSIGSSSRSLFGGQKMGLYASQEPILSIFLAKRVFPATCFFVVTNWKNRESNILELNSVKGFKNVTKCNKPP